MHRVMVDSIVWKAGEVAAITGDEAHHAIRVKRARAGEHVQLLDGRGHVADGEVVESERGGRELHVRISTVRHEPPASPRVEVWTAVPKGGRVDDMIDQLAQAGAAHWRPLDAARSIVDPRESKMERLARIAAEASKQCGRAWMMEIGSQTTFADALRPAPNTQVVLADATGSPWRTPPTSTTPTTLRLLIGPEGGWTPEELIAAKSAGATLARFGPHIMRIETAAVIACGALMNATASA